MQVAGVLRGCRQCFSRAGVTHRALTRQCLSAVVLTTWRTRRSEHMGTRYCDAWFVERPWGRLRAHLGATPIDYATTGVSEHAGQFDLILDTVGGEAFTQSLPLLTPTGRIITCPDPSQIAAARQVGHDAHWVFVHPNATEVEKISQALASKTLDAHIERVFPFAQLPKAHRLGEPGHVRGKLVLDFDHT